MDLCIFFIMKICEPVADFQLSFQKQLIGTNSVDSDLMPQAAWTGLVYSLPWSPALNR